MNKINIANPSHAYLFVGPLQIAKEYAKTWLCNTQNDTSCNTCKSCIQFDSNNHPDFAIIEAEGNSIKIEQARHLIAQMVELPIVSEKKIFIINEADKMTVQAQNCLLKVLEEPPTYGIIILVGSNEQAFLSTIRSRCIKINFGNTIGAQDFTQSPIMNPYNKDHVGAGLVPAQIEQIINSIETIKKVEINKLSKILLEEKDNLKELLEYINILVYTKGKTDMRYLDCVDIVNNAIRKIEANCNVEMTIDSMNFELWEVINEKYSRSAI